MIFCAQFAVLIPFTHTFALLSMNSSLCLFRTNHDASTNRSWLMVYRQNFNAKFLLTEDPCEEMGNANMPENANKITSVASEKTLQQIQSAVDQMVRLVPPSASTKY